ncbi:MAG: glucose-1-phosphate thymidylyltransferase RfbA [Candidatus Methanomethylophilaceae archaeon]
MKGIILAGGLGTRLYPATLSTPKCLLPVYDRPMIFFPLSTLLQAGIRDILVITSGRDQDGFRRLLGDGSSFGVSIEYAVQDLPRGIADAFLIGEEFIDGDSVMLVLGDNIFHSRTIESSLKESVEENRGATIFGIEVSDPGRFGVIDFDENFNVISIEEKPAAPKSNTAAVGLYIYDGNVSKHARTLKPSPRGELEITDLNNIYLRNGKLKARQLDGDSVWFDAGTHESLLSASVFVYNMEQAGGKISCPEKIALEKGYITQDKLEEIVCDKKSSYYVRIRCECGIR